MNQAVVLTTGKIVKLDSVNKNNAISYFNNGAVKNFYSNDGNYYITVKNKDYGLDNGEPIYVLENQYNSLKKEASKKDKNGSPLRNQITVDMIYDDFITADIGDEVHLPIREQIILQPNNIHKFCTGLAIWTFDGNHFNNFSLIIPPVSAITTSQVNCQIIDSQYQDFINKHGDRLTAGGETINIKIVADIAQILTQFKNEDPNYYNLLEARNLLPVFNQQTSYFSQDINTDFYFYGNDDYEEYRDFLILYKQWFDFQRENIVSATPTEQKFLLISMFNSKELEFVDISDKIEILKIFSKVVLDDSYWLSSLPYRRETVVIKLIKSITPIQSTQFLDALLKTVEGYKSKEPLFKILYNKLDDNRIKRYPLVLDLGIYNDNKKNYINALTKIWRYSKYCPMNYNGSSGFSTVKDDSYFLNEGKGYFVTVNGSTSEYEPITDAILEFGRVEGEVYDTKHSGIKLGRDYRNTYTIEEGIANNNTIKLLKTTYFSDAYYNQNYNVLGYDDAGKKETTLTYHIYQPITLLHYTSDLDLKIPQNSLIPAFLFYYAEDYDKLKDLDAAYSFAIEVGIEVVLFLVSGGASTAKQLLYLRKLSNFGRVVDGTLTTSNVLIKYKQIDNVLQVTSLSSSIASSHYSYLAGTTNNQANIEKYQTQRNLFGLLALGSGIASIYTQYKLPKTCSKLADEIDNATTAGISFEIPPQIKNIVQTIGDMSIYFPAFRNKLVTQFNFSTTGSLITKLDSLSDANKVEFYFEFLNKDKAFFQAIHEYDNAIGVNHWVTLKGIGLPERFELNVLTNTGLVQSYQQFYTNGVLGTLLNTVTISRRKAFIDIFKNIDATNFTKFVNDPTLITKWFRYFDDAVLRENFLILNITKQIEIADFFGDISTYWFKRFKMQPSIFDRYNTASVNSKLLAQSNPKLWIRVNRLYIRPSGLGEKMTNTFLNSKYKTSYAKTLVNAVENRAQEIYDLGESRNYIADNFQLVSGMVDKSTGQTSELFSNFSKQELEPGGLYSKFLETNTNPVLNMHPNLRNIVNDLQGKKEFYNMDSFDNLVYTGTNIAAHAEIRALDNLIKKKFGYSVVDEDTFYIWLENNVLGYNRNVVAKPTDNKVVMHTCADCFYITDLVTFINNF